MDARWRQVAAMPLAITRLACTFSSSPGPGPSLLIGFETQLLIALFGVLQHFVILESGRSANFSISCIYVALEAQSGATEI